VIVPLRGDTPDLLERLGELRAGGDVPLVGDARWPAAQWEAVATAAAAAEVPDDTAWATLTSGSSSAPRIVLRSAASWADSFDAVAGYLDAGRGDTVSLPAPPVASLTLYSLAHALAGGPRPVLHASAQAGALHGTPQALRAMLDGDEPVTLRNALIGGSYLDPSLRQRAEAAGIRVSAYYGAAELSFVAVDEGDGLRPFPGVELRIRDGELWVRSPFVASGYAGAPGPLRREGAWASVGDRAELAGGRLRLLGRADEAILSASATIVPEEVEAVLRTVPGVRDAVVFGLPRAHVGALVAAFLELDGDEVPAVRRIAAAQLSPAHRPRRWYAGELPRTASGKPARGEAVRRVLAGEVPHLEV
jgi:acyl-CoA synthetase (AMP-forming)/AMP-acid ligase II